MNLSWTCVMAALLAVSPTGAATIAHADASGPPAARVLAVDAEHARLVAMSGTWDVEMTFWFRPHGPGVPTKATSTIRPLFEGLFIEEKIEGVLNGAPFTTLAWTGFNPETHQYKAARMASTTPAASSRPVAMTRRPSSSN